MTVRALRRVTVTLVVCGLLPASPSRAESPGKWLVDLARHDAALRQAAPTDADAVHVLTLMQAAARVEPALPEAYYWQYDLLSRLNRHARALDALDNYVRLQPDDLVARLRWIELRIEQAQTAEDRINFCCNLLERDDLPALVRSDLHRHLAVLAYGRGEDQVADQHLELAVKLCPHNIAAARLAVEMGRQNGKAIAQVRMILSLIAASPARLDLLWQLGQLLDDLSLHTQARSWYEHALAMHRRSHPDSPPPAPHLFDLARGLADGGELRKAVEVCEQAIEADPPYTRARLLLWHVASKLGQDDLARQQLDAVDQQYQQRHAAVVQQRDWRAAARMAWFYAIYRPQPERAMQLAALAAAASQSHPEAMRAMGFAALAADDFDKAVEVLKPMAETDQTAALGLARAYLGKGQKTDALAVLDRAAKMRYSGLIFEQIADLLTQNQQPVPPPPDRSDVVKLLSEFDRRVLEFAEDPDKFIELTVRPADDLASVPLSGPWLMRFELRNIGQVPVTLGADLMVNPEVLVSIVDQADRERRFDNACVVWLNRTPLLLPDQSVVVTQSIDVGPIRVISRRSPQLEHHLDVEAIVCPTQTQEGSWVCDVGGVRAQPLRLVRPHLTASPEQVDALIAATTMGPLDLRCRAVDSLGSLLAEAQLLSAAAIEYGAMPVDVESIRNTLQVRLMDDEPLIRARVLSALHVARLDDELVRLAGRALSDSHWLVRMMAVRLLADKHKSKFAPVVDTLMDADADPLVRQLCRTYRAGFSATRRQQ